MMDEMSSRVSPIGREQSPTEEEYPKWRSEANTIIQNDGDSPLASMVLQASRSCQQRLQNAINLLLTSGEIRPLQSSTSACTLHRSFTRCRDKVLGHAREVTSSLRSLVTILTTGLARSRKTCMCLEELRDAVVTLVESCAHAAYVRAMQHADSRPVTGNPAGFDRYSICCTATSLERKLATFRRLSPEELTATARTDVCQHVDVCVDNLERFCETSTLPMDVREPLKLCCQSVRSSCEALKAVVGGLAKDKMSAEALACCQTLADSVVASCHGLVAFVGTRRTLAGSPVHLGPDAKFQAWTLMSSAVGVVSPCILACELVSILARNPNDTNAQAKAKGCLSVTTRGTVKLAKALGVTIIDITS